MDIEEALQGSLTQLNDRIDQIERTLLYSVNEEVIKHFVGKGFTRDGGVITSSDLSLRVLTTHNVYQRQLQVSVTSNRRPEKTWTEEVPIDTYGRIASVSIKWPTQVARRNRRLLTIIQSSLQDAYLRMKYAVLEGFAEGESAFFYTGLQSCINRHLETHGLPDLIDKIVPAISRLSEPRFRYGISPSSAESILEMFRSAKDLEYSAVELLLSLSLSEEGHTINQTFKDYTPGAVLHLPSQKFVSFESNHAFFVAESHLFSYGELAEFNICSTKDFVLQLGVPRMHASRAQDAIADARPELERRFCDNEARYKRILQAIRGARSLDAGTAFEAGNFVGGVIHGIGHAILRNGL